MTDLILILVIAAIIAAAGCYIYKAKKRGVKCIGCPEGCKCGSSCNCNEEESPRSCCGNH